MEAEYNRPTHNEDQLVVNENIKQTLLEATKWSKIIAIIGFVGIGLMIILGIFSSVILSYTNPLQGSNSFGSGLIGFIYIAFACIYVLPIKYLYDFSTKIKDSILSNEQELFEDGMSKLKSFYKYIGIFTIVIIILYAIIFAFAILAGVIGSLIN